MSTVFSAVADETRRGLLERLREEGPLSISAMAEGLPISRQGVTKHLAVLLEAGLVRAERRGRQRLHRLNPSPLKEVDDWLRPYAEAWERRLERLKHHLEEEGS